MRPFIAGRLNRKLLDEVNPEMLLKNVEEYLNEMMAQDNYRSFRKTAIFLGVSYISFISSLGTLVKEGYLLKRSGSTRVNRV